MKYKTYFDVPDGARCRPVKTNSFYEIKGLWIDAANTFKAKEMLGEWETEEKKIEISREELDQKLKEYCKYVRFEKGVVLEDVFLTGVLDDLFGSKNV